MEIQSFLPQHDPNWHSFPQIIQKNTGHYTKYDREQEKTCNAVYILSNQKYFSILQRLSWKVIISAKSLQQSSKQISQSVNVSTEVFDFIQKWPLNTEGPV